MTELKKKSSELKIKGMTCATCAQTIEKSLKKLAGVSDAKVNLGKETAQVKYDDLKVRLVDLERAVTDAGYGVINEKKDIKVGGMTCATCVKTIENALKKLDGVAEVNVNLGAEKAYITFNPTVTDIPEMKKAIEDAGYQYLGLEGEMEDAVRSAQEKDLQQKRVRFIVGFAVGVPLMVIGYLQVGLGIPLPYLMLVISTPAFIYIGYPIFTAGYRAIRNQILNMDVMYSMGIGVAFISSILGTFGVVLSEEFMFYDTAVLLATFLTVGRYLEAQAKSKTSDAIKKLMGLQPKYATVVDNGIEKKIAIEDVEVGDVVLVKPGDKIPVDGEVIEGKSYVDESMITGEPIPNPKRKGGKVIGGTLNKSGVIKFKTTKVGKDTILHQIVKLVTDAQGSRPPVQRIADRAVSYFIPAVITIAISSFVIWYIIVGYGLLFSMSVLISILVIACPCALGLATPTAVTVGIGRSAELGVLIKSGEALEISDKLSAVVFDKTGTLTKGKPAVTDIVSFGPDEDELLKLSASVEKNSSHPLAEAILAKAMDSRVELIDVTDFELYSGKGVVANIAGKEIIIGNRILFEEKKITYDNKIDEKILELENEGKTVLLISFGNKIGGLIAIADTVKETTEQAVNELREMGFKIYMITGDNRRTADAVAREIGIDQVLSEVLPQDKANEVKRLQKEGKVVAFVGDGINDAPALAQADVGVAIGSGTDIAIESGEVVLIRDDLIDVVAALQLSKKVMRRIKQNLFWAFAYNTALIPVAAGILYPFFEITFKPELAGLAMAMSSVTVVTLSLMLKGYVPPVKRKEVR